MARIKVEDLEKLEDVTDEDMQAIRGGGKDKAPARILRGYRLLKIRDDQFYKNLRFATPIEIP